MALVNGGFLHYMDMKKFDPPKKHGFDELGLLALYRDMKKFVKNLLLRNCWSDFEIIS